ncbi:MAG: hypothetical protein MJZ61_01160 [Bacteroidales bacterium]|nr:hypothetical protein [Bacteroidales bacterium]
MKNILLFVVLFMVGSIAYGQRLASVKWLNGTKTYSLAHGEVYGMQLMPTEASAVSTGVKYAHIDYQPIGVRVYLQNQEILNVNPEGINLEVKWFFYAGNRRTLMSTETVRLVPNGAPKDIDSIDIMLKRPRTGWWGVQVFNKDDPRHEILSTLKDCDDNTFQIKLYK